MCEKHGAARAKTLLFPKGVRCCDLGKEVGEILQAPEFFQLFSRICNLCHPL